MDPDACMMMGVEELLNFSSDIGEEDDDDENTKPTATAAASSSSTLKTNLNSQHIPTLSSPHEEKEEEEEMAGAEEELEWLSNKDAFPAVETFFDMAPSVNTNLPLLLLGGGGGGATANSSSSKKKQQSPVSVLENCNNTNTNTSSRSIRSCFGSSIVVPPLSYPVRTRSKRRRRSRQQLQQHCWWWVAQQPNNNLKQPPPPPPPALPPRSSGGVQTIGRRQCQHCLAESTPQWRAGPLGPKTLCNACGVRYKSGRLVPEYRPANSPTFSTILHSNSHRKVLEMRKMKQQQQQQHHRSPGMIIKKEPCGYMVEG